MDHLHTWIPAFDLGRGRYRCSECPQTGYRGRKDIQAHKRPPPGHADREPTVDHTAGRRPDLDWYDSPAWYENYWCQ